MPWAAGTIGLAVAVAVGEVGLRVTRAAPVRRLQARQAAQAGRDEVHPRGLYSLHPEIGWTLTPGFAGRFVKEDFDVEVRANAQGLRHGEVGPKPTGGLRILGLGDSFAFGWGVEQDETFYHIAQQRLADELGRPVEIINAGIPGYGTYEALQLLRAIGLRYEPDAVVLAFYEGNDYSNNGDAPRERVIDDGYLRDAPKHRPSPLRAMIIQWSVLGALVDANVSRAVAKHAFGRNVQRTQGLFIEMQELLAPRGIPLAVVLIPDQDREVYERSMWLRAYDRAMGVDLLAARRQLAETCERRGIAFTTLSREFEGAGAALRLKDTHFNRDGHHLAGEQIAAFLMTAVVPQLTVGDREPVSGDADVVRP